MGGFLQRVLGWGYFGAQWPTNCVELLGFQATLGVDPETWAAVGGSAGSSDVWGFLEPKMAPRLAVNALRTL